MGFIPILITLGGFILLFILVVNHSIKTKKEQYKAALVTLRDTLGTGNKDRNSSIVELERKFEGISGFTASQAKSIKVVLGKAKLQKHQYNQLIQTKPYSFVAKLLGHAPI